MVYHSGVVGVRWRWLAERGRAAANMAEGGGATAVRGGSAGRQCGAARLLLGAALEQRELGEPCALLLEQPLRRPARLLLHLELLLLLQERALLLLKLGLLVLNGEAEQLPFKARPGRGEVHL